MTSSRYLNCTRLFVDTYGKTVSYKVHSVEAMLYLQIESGCHTRGTIIELFEFLTDVGIHITESNSNWINKPD